MGFSRPLAAAVAMLLPLALLAPRVASAEDETGECLTASEAGQRLRDDRKFVEAREQLTKCARDVCPHVVRKDCLRWIEELRDSQSSIVLGARDGGRDRLDVRAMLDGKVVAEVLDGKSILVNPGPHRLRFERQHGSPVEIDVVVREGEKNRVVAVDFPREAAPLAREEAAPPSGMSGRQTAGIVAGSVGILAIGIGAYFGVLAIHHRTESDRACPNGNCTAEGVSFNDSAISAAWGADIAIGLGIVGVAVGTYLLLTSSPARAGAGHASSISRLSWSF
jgi:hypothetical protein